MVLHAIQEQFGWISREAVLWTAKKLELQPINVFEILTFYPMLRQEPMGQYQIKGLPHLELRAGRRSMNCANIFARGSAWTRMQARRARRRRMASSRWNLSSALPVAAAPCR